MTPTKYNFYKTVAQNYKASLLTTQYRAVVHLENKNDEVFWGKVLEEACPNDQFRFVSSTRTPSGNAGEGCGQCLVFKDFLDTKLVIGIDSDLRYLHQEVDVDAVHFILQTYTYSFENHLCFADRLNLLSEKVCGLPNELFDFGQFLMAYSKEIYPLFLLFLYDFRQLGEKMLNKDFFKLLSFPDIPDKLKNDGASVISELHDRVTAEIKRLKGSYPDIDETAERTKYAALGLCEDNAYLYVRGHNLYDLIVRIGESLCYELKKAKTNVWRV